MLLRLADVVERAIAPALAILGPHMDTPQARVMLLAIGLQESSFSCRRQANNGPACGFWQTELGSVKPPAGLGALYANATTHGPLGELCHARDLSFDLRPIWEALEEDDVLAAGVARLFLLAERRPLPDLGDEQAAWQCYLRCWNPGKPRPRAWPVNYALALSEVKGKQ